MAYHIVFVEPEIPPNTGNIARTCAATNSVLHLVKPLGFDIDDRAVKRAGLDYWPYVKLEIHESLQAFMEEYENKKRMFFVSTQGAHYYTDFQYRDEDMFLFGRETRGLPRDLLAEHPKHCIRIPMSEDTKLRSLNLANSANIVLFEALRQIGFPGLG